ncbi:MAG: hypothetical protein NTX96_02495 [Candidatus Zambryskibacteria bacterium]|nr:hypothetical protein [Candidatus Zambryskibacteria bacterium]
MKDDSIGILVLLGIIAIALFGGAKNTNNIGPIFSNNQAQTNVEQGIQDTQNQINDLKQQLQIEEDKKTQSQYKGIVTLSYINRSTDPSQEYVTIKVSYGAVGTIPVTGWILKSLDSGTQVTIPKGTYLFFTGMMNAEDDIYLNANDVLYLITGISPVGASFKVNKCSGYLGQFQTFIPYLNTNCPAPRNEDLSSIPNSVRNGACLDYIDSMNQCQIRTESPLVNWSSECIDFIYNKINYPSCVDIHKNDGDFYEKEWRVYLKRSESIWRDKRETIVLYDNVGKIVDTLKY